MRRAAWLIVLNVESLVQHAASAPMASAQPIALSQKLFLSRSAAGFVDGAPARWSHCSCSGDLSLPPPQKVLVEYSPAEVDTFIAFADAVEEEFAGIMVDGIEVEGRPGAFDIKLEDGQTIFSTILGSGSSSSLPEYSDLFARLRQAGVQAAAA